MISKSLVRSTIVRTARSVPSVVMTLLLLAPHAMHAQATQTPIPAQPPLPSVASGASAATPSAEALSLARTLIQKTNTGGLSALSGTSAPMAGVLHDLGVHPDQSRAVVQEAIFPVLTDHSDEMTEIAATSYASVLTVQQLKDAVAFYDTDAGKALVRAHFRIVQMNMSAFQTLFQKLMPEFQAKTQEVFKAHNWTKS